MIKEFDIAYSIVKLYVETIDGESGTGTSFFYKFRKNNQEKIVLITNKHVLKEVKEITFFLHNSFTAPGIIRKLVLSGNDLNRIIINHPSNFDICALDISNYLNDNDAYYCFKSEDISFTDYVNKNNIMEDVFIVGYPIGLEDSLNRLPIFTTGTTATSLAIDYNGFPLMLINAFALPGSSGSPVFIKKESAIKLIGIISSGNLLKGNIPVDNLCYAIKSNLINEIESVI
jgi:hypothetical protein